MSCSTPIFAQIWSSVTFMMICRFGTIMLPPLKSAFRFSGNSTRPAYPGFMVMKKPTLRSRLKELPSVKTNVFFPSLMALKMQCTYICDWAHMKLISMPITFFRLLLQAILLFRKDNKCMAIYPSWAKVYCAGRPKWRWKWGYINCTWHSRSFSTCKERVLSNSQSIWQTLKEAETIQVLKDNF